MLDRHKFLNALFVAAIVSAQASFSVIQSIDAQTRFATLPANAPYYSQLPTSTIVFAIAGPKEWLAVGTPLGVSVSKDRGATFINLTTADGLSSNEVTDASWDLVTGELFVATTKGIDVYNPQTNSITTNRFNQFKNAHVKRIHVKNNVLHAVATNKLEGDYFYRVASTPTKPERLYSNMTSFLATDSTIYIGSQFAGINIFSLASVESPNDKMTITHDSDALFPDSIAVFGNAIYVLVGSGDNIDGMPFRSDKFVRLYRSDDSARSFQLVKTDLTVVPSQIFTAHENLFVVSKTAQKLYFYHAEKNNFVDVTSTFGLEGKSVSNVCVQDSRIYFSTDDGLVIAHNNGATIQVNYVNAANTYSGGNVRAIFAENDDISLITNTREFFTSHDRGYTFTRYPHKEAKIERSYNTAFKIAARDRTRLVTAGHDLLISSDNGETYSLLDAPGLPKEWVYVSHLDIVDNIVYVALFESDKRSRLYSSTDNAQTFSLAFDLKDEWAVINSVIQFNGDIYVATTKGLLTVSGDLPLLDKRVRSLCKTSKALWIVAEGILYSSTDGKYFFEISMISNADSVVCHDDSVYVTTWSKGLIVLPDGNDRDIQVVDVRNGLGSNGVNAISFSREGNLFVATPHGLCVDDGYLEVNE